MRVAMVILEYHPITGGAQRQLAAVAPWLQRRGVEVHVLTRPAPGRPAHEVVDGVPVHRLPAPGPKPTASAVFTASALARLRRLRPDVVHAYSLFSPTTIAMLARRHLGTPAVVKVLRGGFEGDVERLRRKALARGRIAGLRRRVDRFLTISREIDAELASLGIAADRRLALPNGVDTERFRPLGADARRGLRERLGWPAGPIAVYCGRLVPEKQVDRLLEAWRRVRAAHPEACLAIVGDGPESDRLRRLAGEGVRFEGETADVAPCLQAADAFVLPSAAEGLSNALLEAMAAGLPVVATRVGGAVDVIEDGRSGRLVDPADPAALAAALAGVIGDPERARLGERARSAMLAGYSLGSVAERLGDLYAELAEPGARRGAAADRAARQGVRA